MITFPNESAKYRTAREKLLRKEIELRRAMEAVAEARRALPPGGLVSQHYVFDALDAGGRATKVKFPDLFAPGKDTLILYQMMFPRHPQETRDVAASGETAKLARQDQPCPSCTALLDQFDGAIGHLEAAGFNFAVVAKTGLDNLTALARDRGWKTCGWSRRPATISSATTMRKTLRASSFRCSRCSTAMPTASAISGRRSLASRRPSLDKTPARSAPARSCGT